MNSTPFIAANWVRNVEDNLTIANVRAWAKKAAPTDILGTARSALGCPLARFCEQVLQSPVSIGRRWFGVTTAEGVEWHDMPQWARRFIYTVDTCLDDNVTAEQVLTALDDAEAHMVEKAENAWDSYWSQIVASTVVVSASSKTAVQTEEKVLVPA